MLEPRKPFSYRSIVGGGCDDDDNDTTSSSTHRRPPLSSSLGGGRLSAASLPPAPPSRRRRYFYLTPSILNVVFEYLWAVDLGAATCVCRSWMMTTKNDNLWRGVASMYGVDVDAVTLAVSSANGSRSRLRPSSASTKSGFWRNKVMEAVKARGKATEKKQSTLQLNNRQALSSSSRPSETTPNVVSRRSPAARNRPPPPPFVPHGAAIGVEEKENNNDVTTTTANSAGAASSDTSSATTTAATKGKYSDGIKRRTIYVPESVAAVEKDMRVEPRDTNTFSSELRAHLKRPATWQPPRRSVDDELDYMAHHVYATASTISDAEKVRLVEDQMTMMRRRLQSAGAGVDSSAQRLNTLTTLSRPMESQLRSQLSGVSELATSFAQLRKKERRNDEFMKRRSFIDSFEAIVMESHALTPQVFGTSTFMRWSLMKRTVPVTDAYYDAIDAILDAPFTCDDEDSTASSHGENDNDESSRYDGEWWFLPAIGGGTSVVISTMKAVLLLQREKDLAVAEGNGDTNTNLGKVSGFDDILLALSESSGKK